jgi:cell division protein FtsW
MVSGNNARDFWSLARYNIEVHRRRHQQPVTRVPRNSVDKVFLGVTLLLAFLGTLAIADASAPMAQAHFGDSLYFVKQHVVWLALGVIALGVGAHIPYTLWKKYSVPLFTVAIILLVVVLIPGIGIKLLGARRWINLGFTSFQPSEVAKFALCIYFARLADAKKPLKSFLLVLAFVSGLIMLQPDLGTTIIVVSIGFMQLFISGVPFVEMAKVIAAGIIGALGMIFTSDYRRERILTYFSHGDDPHGISYHINQVLIALGSGGLFGVGLGQSRQKYLFLPESATDSVFAVIGEEIGFIGSAALIALFVFFLYRGLKIAREAPDTFATLLAGGLVSWLAIQFFLNISSMVALTPLTGVPLPFFSYGGTSLTLILFGIGILLQISRHGKR